MSYSMDSSFTTYSTQLKDLSGGKVFLAENNHELCLNLVDSCPPLPSNVVQKKIRLLYRQKPFTTQDVESVRICIKSWADSNFTTYQNHRRLVAFSLGKGQGLGSITVEGDLASLYSYVYQHMQTQLGSDLTQRKPFIPTVNIPTSMKSIFNRKSKRSRISRKNNNISMGQFMNRAPSSSANQSFGDVNPLEWTSKHVQAWLSSLGSPISDISHKLKNYNGLQFLALSQNENEIQQLLGDAYYAAQQLTSYLEDLLEAYEITNDDINMMNDSLIHNSDNVSGTYAHIASQIEQEYHSTQDVNQQATNDLLLNVCFCVWNECSVVYCLCAFLLCFE